MLEKRSLASNTTLAVDMITDDYRFEGIRLYFSSLSYNLPCVGDIVSTIIS